MKKSETKKAIALLGGRVQKSETINCDGGGLALTIYWVGGSQTIFYTLFEVESWLESRNHGGAREGAGSKPKRGVAKVTLSLRVTPEVKVFLNATGNASETIEDMVRRSKAFRCK